jgi:hypothetical protein
MHECALAELWMLLENVLDARQESDLVNQHLAGSWANDQMMSKSS